MEKYGLEFNLEHVMSYKAFLAPPEIIGPTPDGLRMNIYVTGGEVWGPKIKAGILPVGGDWFTLRPDGIGILDVRATMETDDGALVYIYYYGTTDLGEKAYEEFLKNEREPHEGHIRSCPRLSTAHPAYSWLNRLFCIGIGKVNPDITEIIYDIYAVK